MTHGVASKLRDALAEVAHVDRALIYGSWAARRAGETGPPPNDVDVLVEGHADRRVLVGIADAVGTAARIDVSIRQVPRGRWEDVSDPFIQTVRSRPFVELDLEMKRGRHDRSMGEGPRRGSGSPRSSRPKASDRRRRAATW